MAKNKLAKAVETSGAVPIPAKEIERYKVEDALSCIERAEGYKKDKSLMKGVKKLAREKIKNLAKVK